MKILYSTLAAIGFSANVIPVQAQVYLSGLNNYNNGGIISYYADSAIVASSGSYTAVNSALTIHGGKVLHVTGPYTAGTGSIDSLIGDGTSVWPPVAAVKTISGSAAPEFDIVNFVNGPGQAVNIINAGGANVATSAYFGNGLTTTVRSSSNAGALRFLDNATYNSSALGDAQYVNGYVSKIGNDAFTFPVGSQAGNDLRTLQIGAPAAATDHLSVAYWSGDASSGIDPTPAGAQSLTALNPAGTAGVDQLFSVSPICFWDWVPVNGTSAITITVSIPAFSGNGGYTSAASMRLVGWNTATSQWDNLSGTSGASGTAEGSTLSGTVTNMSTYSAIAIGSVLEIPLPVTITRFEGKMDNSCNADLVWETSLELDVDQFVIQYSNDGGAFTKAAEVKGKNSGNAVYTTTIQGIPYGTAFFRLMTMDRDGTVSYHNETLKLFSACEGSAAILVSPNPASNSLHIKGITGKSTLTILDITGRQLIALPAEKGTATIDLSGLAKGAYFLRILNKDNKEVVNTKIVKQ